MSGAEHALRARDGLGPFGDARWTCEPTEEEIRAGEPLWTPPTSPSFPIEGGRGTWKAAGWVFSTPARQKRAWAAGIAHERTVNLGSDTDTDYETGTGSGTDEEDEIITPRSHVLGRCRSKNDGAGADVIFGSGPGSSSGLGFLLDKRWWVEPTKEELDAGHLVDADGEQDGDGDEDEDTCGLQLMLHPHAQQYWTGRSDSSSMWGTKELQGTPGLEGRYGLPVTHSKDSVEQSSAMMTPSASRPARLLRSTSSALSSRLPSAAPTFSSRDPFDTPPSGPSRSARTSRALSSAPSVFSLAPTYTYTPSDFGSKRRRLRSASAMTVPDQPHPGLRVRGAEQVPPSTSRRDQGPSVVPMARKRLTSAMPLERIGGSEADVLGIPSSPTNPSRSVRRRLFSRGLGTAGLHGNVEEGVRHDLSGGRYCPHGEMDGWNRPTGETSVRVWAPPSAPAMRPSIRRSVSAAFFYRTDRRAEEHGHGEETESMLDCDDEYEYIRTPPMSTPRRLSLSAFANLSSPSQFRYPPLAGPSSTLQLPSTPRLEAASKKAERRDQNRHIGTHLSAKYGLGHMFATARQLLDQRQPGDESSGATWQPGLGGLSFFLGCPKRHPTPPIHPPGIRSPSAGLAPDNMGGRAEGTGGNRSWDERVRALRAGVRELATLHPGLNQRIFVHAHETGNLALATPRSVPNVVSATATSGEGQKESAYDIMMDGYRAQMSMLSEVGLEYLLVHPGAANDLDEGTAWKNVSANLDRLLAEFPSINIVLESMACSSRGTLVGTTFASLSAIRRRSRFPDRVKFCLDLCHVHSVSHDLSSPQGRERLEADVEAYLGRENVVLVHVSECGTESGSGADVHRPFGQGYIGSPAIREILRSRLFHPSTPSARSTTAQPPGPAVASGPVIIIETPRYLPPTISSHKVQVLEARRCALDMAYLSRLAEWDDDTYDRQWQQWERDAYKPKMRVLRQTMRRCATPRTKGHQGLEERIKLGRQARAKLGRWRLRTTPRDRLESGIKQEDLDIDIEELGSQYDYV